MHRRTVRRGLNLVTVGIATIILATFYADRLVRSLFFSTISVAELVFFGLFVGGLVSGAGIMTAVAGAVRRRETGNEPLLPALVALAVVIILFFTLCYLSLSTPSLPPIRPGETVTI